MKLVGLFGDFLEETVNLNATRVGELEASIDAIKGAIKAAAWTPSIESWMAQGSWAHKTIIRPTSGGEYDADLIAFVKPVEGWRAAQYIDSLYNELRSHGTYRDKVRRFSHCVTVEYKNDKRIDIAPCVVNRGGWEHLEVCNRSADSFESSEPRKYTSWLIQQNGLSGSNSFRKVTRLIKYLRDIKGTFTCSSVLLTTLLATHIFASDVQGTEFSDTPTALRTLFTRLDTWAQAQPVRPPVCNPFLTSEDFGASWTDAQYQNFRSMVSKYREWIEDAFAETNRAESISKWRRVFGDEFAKNAVINEARSVSDSALAIIRKSFNNAEYFAGDIVDAIQNFGRNAWPNEYDKQPHMQVPVWKRSTDRLTIQVRAQLYQSKRYGLLGDLQPFAPTRAGQWIEFRAVTGNGVSVNRSDFRVEWRVTNTDRQASDHNCLRGDFYASDAPSGNTRGEGLEYRGIHLVEAFVIRKRDNRLVGVSPPFHVLIE